MVAVVFVTLGNYCAWVWFIGLRLGFVLAFLGWFANVFVVWVVDFGVAVFGWFACEFGCLGMMGGVGFDV